MMSFSSTASSAERPSASTVSSLGLFLGLLSTFLVGEGSSSTERRGSSSSDSEELSTTASKPCFDEAVAPVDVVALRFFRLSFFALRYLFLAFVFV